MLAHLYHELQGIAHLEAARRVDTTQPATRDSYNRAIMQAMEVGLLNTSDLLTRATEDLSQGKRNLASEKMGWVADIQELMARLSVLPHQGGATDCPHTVHIADSPAFKRYLDSQRQWDRAVLREIPERSDLLRHHGLSEAGVRLLQASQTANQQAGVWAERLASVPLSAPVQDYASWVGSHPLDQAVHGLTLKGDTYFTQFRGLHQIPEILCHEANDHLERSIQAIRQGRPQPALEGLQTANHLVAAMRDTMPILMERLTPFDYHQIRENLGLTSGSHSVGLHYHLFRDLYGQLGQSLTQAIATRYPADTLRGSVEAMGARRNSDPVAGQWRTALDQSLQLRELTLQWRDYHINYARNNLGGGQSKSLAGSQAIKTLERMKQQALDRDPLAPIAAVPAQVDRSVSPLEGYLNSPHSLNQVLLGEVAHLTAERFPDVQERRGFFSQPNPFRPPRPRIVE